MTVRPLAVAMPCAGGVAMATLVAVPPVMEPVRSIAVEVLPVEL